jgi:hypothetical protein
MADATPAHPSPSLAHCLLRPNGYEPGAHYLAKLHHDGLGMI